DPPDRRADTARRQTVRAAGGPSVAPRGVRGRDWGFFGGGVVWWWVCFCGWLFVVGLGVLVLWCGCLVFFGWLFFFFVRWCGSLGVCVGWCSFGVGVGLVLFCFGGVWVCCLFGLGWWCGVWLWCLWVCWLWGWLGCCWVFLWLGGCGGLLWGCFCWGGVCLAVRGVPVVFLLFRRGSSCIRVSWSAVCDVY
ncbi:hypothetical protein RA276_27635, partial [Pseudomonas syringae pv. tagetis]|uniref:hypothetical protein n=1 Tax=Pseudomonas syringae group genomosp. 7 TaxID=251699 RepID=UPI0037701360